MQRRGDAEEYCHHFLCVSAPPRDFIKGKKKAPEGACEFCFGED